MMRAAIPLILLLLMAAPAHAIDCNGTQSEMNECAASGYRQADAALNSVYQRLVARLTEPGRARLREAQRAWVAYRDEECDFMSSGVEGGSVQPMIAAMCLEAETRSRTAALRSILVCKEGDLSCP